MRMPVTESRAGPLYGWPTIRPKRFHWKMQGRLSFLIRSHHRHLSGLDVSGRLRAGCRFLKAVFEEFPTTRIWKVALPNSSTCDSRVRRTNKSGRIPCLHLHYNDGDVVVLFCDAYPVAHLIGNPEGDLFRSAAI